MGKPPRDLKVDRTALCVTERKLAPGAMSFKQAPWTPAGITSVATMLLKQSGMAMFVNAVR